MLGGPPRRVDLWPAGLPGLRAIAHGGYIKHRAFFLDEAIAIAASFRLCAVYMPDQYADWKTSATRCSSIVHWHELEASRDQRRERDDSERSV